MRTLGLDGLRSRQAPDWWHLEGGRKLYAEQVVDSVSVCGKPIAVAPEGWLIF